MVEDLGAWLGLIGGALAGGTGTAMALRRRWSRDTVAVANDEAQVNMLEILRRERDDARAAADDAICETIELSNRRAILEGDVDRLRRDNRRLRRLVPAEAQKFVGTDVAPLDGVPYGRRADDSAELLAAAWAKLTHAERQALDLWRAGRTCEQIGQQLGIKPEQAQLRVDNATTALRKLLAHPR